MIQKRTPGWYYFRRGVLSIFFFFLILIPYVYSQQQVVPLDSLLQALSEADEDSLKVSLLQQVSDRYGVHAPKQCYDYARQALELSEKIGFKKGVFKSYYNMGNVQAMAWRDYEKARAYYRKASATPQVRERILCLNNIAKTYELEENYNQAIDYLFEALYEVEEINDSMQLAMINHGIASVYMYQEHNEKALHYYEQALGLARALNDPRGISYCLADIGVIYRRQKQWDKALDYYEQSLAIKRQLKDKKGMASLLGNIGGIYWGRKNYKKALEHHLEAYGLYRPLGNPSDISRLSNNIAFDYSYMGQYDSAIHYTEHALRLAEANNIKEQLRRSYSSFTYIYASKKDFQKAYRYQSLLIQVKDSIVSQQHSGKLAELEARYQNEKKEKEIGLLNKEKEVQELNLQRQRARQYYLIGIAVLLLAVALLFINRYRYKQKSNQQLQEKNEQVNTALKERETLLREIHHRVKNNLQIISSLLNLQSRHIEDQQALEAVKEGQNRVKSMALIHQEIYQKDNLTEINAGHYISNLVQGLLKSYELSTGTIELETDIDELDLDVDTTIPLGLIINELVTNTVKYAFPDKQAGKLKIILKKKAHSLWLTVSDNGIGIPEDFELEKARSFGLKLIYSLARKLEAKVSLRKGEGTTIDMEIRNFKTTAA